MHANTYRIIIHGRVAVLFMLYFVIHIRSALNIVTSLLQLFLQID
jgi:hypothetical protein